MKVEAVQNKGPASMGVELDRSLRWCSRVDVASAFVTVVALRRLRAALDDAHSKKRPLKILLRFVLYQRFPPPQAMSEMLAIQKKYPSRFFARISRNKRFHWKLYIFQSGGAR